MSDVQAAPLRVTHGDLGAPPPSRVDRIVAVSRLVIILGSLLALDLDASGRATPPTVAAAVLGVYLCYVIAANVYLLRGRVPTQRWRVADQALDGAIGFILLGLTGGTSSPFFSYLSFPVLFATLRWLWAGALGAGAPTAAAFAVFGLIESHRGPAVDTDGFIMRMLYLGALTGLLCYIGAYEHRVRRTMRAIALWNPSSGNDDADIAPLVETAGTLVGARRAVLAWSNRSDPTLQIAFWSGADVRCWEEADSSVENLVVEPVAAFDFLGHDVATPTAPIWWVADGRLQQHREGPAVAAAWQKRFAMRSVIGARLHGGLVRGWLFLLDVPSMTSDDLLMGGLVARRIHALLEARLTARQFAAAAAAEERTQLARNVHDGALQALTGIRLQLEGARRLLATQPEAAEASLQELHDIITSEHRALRRLVSRLQRAESMTSEPDEMVSDLIAALVARIERQWNVAVRVVTPILDAHLASVPRTVMGEVYHILREALVNAARHAHATTITVSLRVDRRGIRMSVADDGEGFPFTGRHDLARLIRYDMGPTVLRERVAALAGTLVIESSRNGARLDIGIPFAPAMRSSARASSTER